MRRVVQTFPKPCPPGVQRCAVLHTTPPWRSLHSRLSLPSAKAAVVSVSVVVGAPVALRSVAPTSGNEEGFPWNLPRALVAINAINCGVFLLWRVAPAPFMMKHFSCSLKGVLKGRVHTLVTSVFSHESLLHLLANSCALTTISLPLVSILGDEKFFMFWVTAGVSATLLGEALLLIGRRVGRPSLGASGAVLATVTAMSLLFPHAQFSLIFLPTVPISAETIVPLVAGLDTLGLMWIWSGRNYGINHAAHLGGVLFGYLFLQYLYRDNRYVKALMDQNKRKKAARKAARSS